jgi:hypothetical protein
VVTDLTTAEQHVEKPVAPTTTTQQDITTAGQRRINMIWEITQAVIALAVTLANMYVAIERALNPATTNSDCGYPIVLSSAFFLIVGFYFSRTNHQAIGGIGTQPVQRYEGR